MTHLVTITTYSKPVPPLELTPDDARKLGALLISKANEHDRQHGRAVRPPPPPERPPPLPNPVVPST